MIGHKINNQMIGHKINNQIIILYEYKLTRTFCRRFFRLYLRSQWANFFLPQEILIDLFLNREIITFLLLYYYK